MHPERNYTWLNKQILQGLFQVLIIQQQISWFENLFQVKTTISVLHSIEID